MRPISGRTWCEKSRGHIRLRRRWPCASAQAAPAQDYPTRPIRVVIAFPPGGPTDFVGRLVADKLKDTLGQTSSSRTSPAPTARSAPTTSRRPTPDGYTLFLTTVGRGHDHAAHAHDLPYDTLRDFAPVTLVVRNTTVLVVTPEARHQDGQGADRARQGQRTATSRSPRPASARPRISPSNCSTTRRASNSSTCPIAARPRR